MLNDDILFSRVDGSRTKKNRMSWNGIGFKIKKKLFQSEEKNCKNDVFP